MKKIFKLNELFLFLFLILFPFGQVIRIGILHPLDIVVILGAIASLILKQKKPDQLKYLSHFLLYAFASWIFSLFLFASQAVLYGALYLIRLAAYFYFVAYVSNYVKLTQNKKLIIKSLVAVSVISAFFGWVQYVFQPDLKPFISLGWDMHLYRLAGTFLDPTFLGLIIVFGILLVLNKQYETPNFKNYILIVFLFFSLAFTYSRASFLALAVGIVTFAINRKYYKQIFFYLVLLAILVINLPTAMNKSIVLSRTFSIFAKLDNYKNTVDIFSYSPVIGVGYNNICLAYQKIIGPQKFTSHSCSGSDSSILFVLATMGVIGLIVFFYSIVMIGRSIKKSDSFPLVVASSASLFVHSLFSNSFFYPWVLGWMVILLALAI